MKSDAPAIISQVFGLLLTGILLGFPVQAWAYSGDTIQDDIAREFNGATSYTISTSAPTQSSSTAPTESSPTSQDTCEQILQEEMDDNQISDTEACVCSSSSVTPQCTSYYDLCEAALPSYQNSSNECTCSQTATSAVPACESNYDICESSAAQYESASTTCSCSQTSTSPYCCTSQTVTSQTSEPGIAVASGASGIGAVFCGNASRSVEVTSSGQTCPAGSGITVCALGICRNWVSNALTLSAGLDSFSETNPSVTYPSGGSYWDWGECDGPNPAGSCTGQDAWYTAFEGPTGYSGANFIIINAAYTDSTTSTTQSCKTE